MKIRVLLLALLASIAGPAAADGFYGMLRARDLTPFGFLRLDMRPAHAVSVEPGSWVVETGTPRRISSRRLRNSRLG